MPRSYYRFENHSDPTIDSVGSTPLVLQPPGANTSTAASRSLGQGGQTGSYVEFSASDAYAAWGANAGQLPRQCEPNLPLSHCHSGSAACHCAEPSDPLQTTGLTIELMFRAGPRTKLFSNSTLLSTRSTGAGFGSITWVHDLSRHEASLYCVRQRNRTFLIWQVDLSRHGVSFRQLTGPQDSPRWFQIRPESASAQSGRTMDPAVR